MSHLFFKLVSSEKESLLEFNAEPTNGWLPLRKCFLHADSIREARRWVGITAAPDSFYMCWRAERQLGFLNIAEPLLSAAVTQLRMRIRDAPGSHFQRPLILYEPSWGAKASDTTGLCDCANPAWEHSSHTAAVLVSVDVCLWWFLVLCFYPTQPNWADPKNVHLLWMTIKVYVSDIE